MLAVSVCLGGCGSLTEPPDDAFIQYAAEAFEANVMGSVGGVEFEARLTAGAPPVGGGERDVSLEFFAPTTLSGVKISRQQGVVSYECGGQSFDFEGGGEGWLEIAELLCPRGSVTGVEKVENSATVKVTLSEGDVISVLTVDSRSGHPTEAEQISPRHVSLQVVSFGGKTPTNE